MKTSVENTTKYVEAVSVTVTNISSRLDIIENQWSETLIVIDKQTKEVNKLFTEVKIEMEQEVNEIARETCRDDFSSKAPACCPDCKKAEFRVPPKEKCEDHGCSHSCAYTNTTCGPDGKKLKHSCLFPFKVKGKTYKTCTTQSPFGEVLRPWCYLDTDANARAKDEGDEMGDVGFCDCTELRCICPPGMRLGSDRKRCVEIHAALTSVPASGKINWPHAKDHKRHAAKKKAGRRGLHMQRPHEEPVRRHHRSRH